MNTDIKVYYVSILATLFLEMWKRYSVEITNSWDITNIDIRDEYPRPQYLSYLAKKKSLNFVTGNKTEPGDSLWNKKSPAIVFSSSIVVLLVRYYL